MAYCLTMENQDGVSRLVSDAPPTHYMLKVESFSLLTKNSIDKYESGEFDAGGYKWRLVLHPNGNKNKNVKDHISLYLGLEGASSRALGWEIFVTYRLFLLDQNNDNYLVVQDGLGKERRFHQMKLEWGVDEFISLKIFKDGSNGYLVDDACVFGAEVFVSRERSTGKGECLTMMKDISPYEHVWVVNNFSSLAEECYDSEPFMAGNYKWKIQLYPKGKGTGEGRNLSLFLTLVDPATLSPTSKIYTKVILSVTCYHWYGYIYVSHPAKFWFTATSLEHGWTNFMLLSDDTPYYQGDLVKDSCSVEADVTILGVVDTLP